MGNIYNEDSIITLAPREAVRESLGMYISNSESGGMHHLSEEIICNAMDEAAAGYGDVIMVKVDSNLNKLTIIDKGRGIPFRKNKADKYAIKEMCTSLHSGGKFTNAGNYKSAIGLNGVGATVTNALSSYFYIKSTREDGESILEFIDGKESKFSIVDGKHTSTGSIVSFIPDKEIFNNIKWSKDKLLDSLQIHAILNEGIEFVLYWDNEQPIKFCYTNGVKEYLKIMVGDKPTVSNVIYGKFLMNKGTDTQTSVEMAIQYVKEGTERIYAFTNGAYNPDFGTHVTGFKSAFTSLLNAKARELEMINADEDNIDGLLLRRGLILVLKLQMSERPQFNEQTKLKLTSPSARASTSQAVSQLIISKADAESIINKALMEKRAEDAIQRKRNAEKIVASGGKNIDTLRDLSEKFADCIDKTDNELFIVEGETQMNCPYSFYH